MTKTTKRSLLVFTIAVLVAAVAFVIVRITTPSKDLRAALASALHLPKDREQPPTSLNAVPQPELQSPAPPSSVVPYTLPFAFDGHAPLSIFAAGAAGKAV